MLDLFADEAPWSEPLAPGAMILRRLARAHSTALLAAIEQVAAVSPFRHMVTPGGYTMSVAMTNCGPLGWSTDRHGYCYAAVDPLSGKPWPAMPDCFRQLAQEAASGAGYPTFNPDACLINRYQPGAKLSLHQDKDEVRLDAPIVSVSLGLPAVFQFGGLNRSDPLQRVLLEHGDVVVWGGESRLFYHAILPLKEGSHPQVGPWRYNLTFRRAAE
ncbi:TPA: DNA oxidative demethylase AlkB [Kluyvera georgiana]|uniref:Alpha-ketoglutarate-dependent dioxygenase AlkB n=1 Tax=Kluyvera georgiana ATCC 51603 TaxID=1354264 RepID=A0A1B7K350_9ENTR|nr:DNA oxidative demethylase AlkB [Kluyvera georgiana]OAT54570.1 alkylated DNA repair protein [Kluyvera georgiana ATCC 51603]